MSRTNVQPPLGSTSKSRMAERKPPNLPKQMSLTRNPVSTRKEKQKRTKTIHNQLDSLFYVGIKCLLLGVSPDKFLSNKGWERFLVYFVLILFFFVYSIFQLCAPYFFPCDFLQGLWHFYFGSYCLTFGYQWIYLLGKFNQYDQNRLHLECFNSSRAVPEIAEVILERKLKSFMRRLICIFIIFSTAAYFFGIGQLIKFGLEYFVTGEVKTILTYFPFPTWGQLIIVVVNTITICLLFTGTQSALIITGLLTLEIETQCAVLGAAMVRDRDEGSTSFRGFIADHVQIVKNARWLIDLLESLNSPAFSCFYFHIATGLVLLVEANGYFVYVSMATAFLSVILQAAAQGWCSSAITHSLESIGFGAYGTNWYERDRNYARDVLMVIRMSQRRFVQKIFFRSIEIDRGTVLRIIRSSYSFYTILMVVQSKKTTP